MAFAKNKYRMSYLEILSSAAQYFVYTTTLAKENSYPSSWAGETHSRNFDENEKATVKVTTKSNLPTVSKIHRLSYKFRTRDHTAINQRIQLG